MSGLRAPAVGETRARGRLVPHRDDMPAILALVERQVIPRLADSLDRRLPTRAARSAEVMHAQTLRRMVECLLLDDPRPARELLARLRAGGAPADALCLGLLSQAARRLGELWEQDLASCSEVTIGTLRLQAMLHALAPELIEGGDGTASGAVGGTAGGAAALLVPVPGETHGLGISMLGEFFRRDGWTVCTPLPSASEDLGAQLQCQEIDLVGLSIAGEAHIATLREQVARARDRSARPGLIVMVGGPLLARRPEIARLVDADATAADAEEAVRFAGLLLRARRQAEAAAVRPDKGRGSASRDRPKPPGRDQRPAP